MMDGVVVTDPTGDLSASEREAAPMLELRSATKRYGQTAALVDADLHVGAGKIHGLIGENGSGKSTIIKILSGVTRLSGGELLLRDEPVTFDSPRDALARGIITVFQETLVVDDLSLLDNILVGTDGLIRQHRGYRSLTARATQYMDELAGVHVQLDTMARGLSTADRQLLTIVRALIRPWSLLLLDEATSALDVPTRERLFALLSRELQGDKAVVFVSHRMDEIEQMSSVLTVLRSGSVVGSLAAEEITASRIVAMMSGRSGRIETDTREVEPDHTPQSAAGRAPRPLAGDGNSPVEPALRLDSVRPVGFRSTVTLDVLPGEIVGVAALEGSGQTELLLALAGQLRTEGGTITVSANGQRRHVVSAPSALKAGLAYVPGDRKVEALFPPLSILDNLSLPTLPRYSWGGLINKPAVRRLVRGWVDDLDVRPNQVDVPVSSLSGGNQQKVVLGRWLAARPAVLVLNDPLRGVDVAVRRDVCERLKALSATGMAIVFFSTELSELLMTCTSLCVVRQHELVSLDQPVAELTQDDVVDAMFGASHPRGE